MDNLIPAAEIAPLGFEFIKSLPAKAVDEIFFGLLEAGDAQRCGFLLHEIDLSQKIMENSFYRLNEKKCNKILDALATDATADLARKFAETSRWVRAQNEQIDASNIYIHYPANLEKLCDFGQIASRIALLAAMDLH